MQSEVIVFPVTRICEIDICLGKEAIQLAIKRKKSVRIYLDVCEEFHELAKFMVDEAKYLEDEWERSRP